MGERVLALSFDVWPPGRGKDAPHHKHLSPAPDKITDHLPPLTGCSTIEEDPAPLMGSTVDQILMIGIWVSQPQENEHGRFGPSISHARERCPTPTLCVAGWRAGLEVIRAEKLSRFLTCCIT